jgi:hypothetical protein
MKAWRAHNSALETKAKMHESFGEKAEAEALRKLKLTNKSERRSQYAAEISEPSSLLYKMMYGPNWQKIIEDIGNWLMQQKAARIAKKQEDNSHRVLTRQGGKWIRQQNLK